MENAVVVYTAESAVVQSKGKNYLVSSPFGGAEKKLERDIDFGVIPKTKKPTLYKAGAEKICMLYGMMARFYIESKIERTEDNPLFFYSVRCDLVKIADDGKEYVVANGYGSANTNEKRNGFNGAYDAANNALKMAKKRAHVDAALTISGLSSMFAQDIENEDFMKGADEIVATVNENSPVTAKQIQRLYAIAAENGFNAAEAKQKIKAAGFASTKDITQKTYDDVCALFKTE